MSAPRTAVVGAGLAGAVAARGLAALGHAVTLFDKSPRVGGRLATRRVGAARIDHGCQSLPATDANFNDYLARAGVAHLLSPWPDDAAAPPVCLAGPGPHLAAPAGVRGVVEALLAGHAVRGGCKVVKACPTRAGWSLDLEPFARVECDNLVLALPVPQACELLFNSGVGVPRDDLHALREVEYARCLALLAVGRGPERLPVEVMHLRGDRAAWLALFSPSFSESAWDEPVESLAARLWPRNRPGECHLHRWRYCRPLTPFPRDHYHDPGRRLTLVGDGFGTAAAPTLAAFRSALAGVAAIRGPL